MVYNLSTEHSVVMLFVHGTKYSQAHQSLRNKEWNRKAFRGLNFMAKLGVIGVGLVWASLNVRRVSV